MVKQNYTIQNSMPAAKWSDATPLGNGEVGAMVYGSIYDERILLNHEQLYCGGVEKELVDISGYLKDVRNMLDKGEYKKADTYFTEKLNEYGYVCNTASYSPAFDIRIITKTYGAFYDYNRSLDMQNGISKVSWEDSGRHCRETFVDFNSGLIFMKYTCDKPTLSFDIRLEPHDLNDCVDSDGNKVKTNFSYRFGIYEKYLLGKSAYSSDMQCNALLRVYGDGEINLYNCSNVKKLNDMQGTADFDSNYYSVKNASEVTVVCNLFCGNDDDLTVERKKLESCSDFSSAVKQHCQSFSKQFNSMTFSLDADEADKVQTLEQLLLSGYNGNVPNKLIQNMFYFGRYLLISSSGNCSLPANLQGIWNGNYNPAWSCTFFNNENIQMNYWQALQGNLSKTMSPFFELYLHFREDFRNNAKNFFGCRGLLLPAFLDNTSGKKKNLQPHVIYWTASSSWIANMFFDYYDYTLDVDFLRNKAYDFMKECALFYEDFMVKDENNKLKSYPSNSPENCACGAFDGAESVRVAINATMDFASLKQLLVNLIKSVKILGKNEEKLGIWKDMLASVPSYEINEDGALKEWMHKDFRDNYKHRHLSHLYPLFPGTEIIKDSEPALFEACRIAVKNRLELGLKEQTGWSFAHLANIMARLNDSEKALQCLELLIRFCTGPNLFTYHNDWRNQGVTLKYLWAKASPFQIDANLGFSAAIIEMLCFSSENLIKILPALPKKWLKGSIRHCLARGGIDVCIFWDNGKLDVTLISQKHKEISLLFGKDVFSLICSENYTLIKNGIKIFLEKDAPIKISAEYKA